MLDEALVSHVGFVADGRPVVLPHLHARVGSTLYLHGSTGARALLSAHNGGLAKELAATAVLRLPLQEVSVKSRSGPPNDDAEDLDLPHWAGVLPLTTARVRPSPRASCRPTARCPST